MYSKKEVKKNRKKLIKKRKERAMLTPQVHILLPGNPETSSVAEIVSKTSYWSLSGPPHPAKEKYS